MTSPVLAVSAVIVDAHARVLLVLRGHEPAQGLWSLPGGSVEQGENMREALVREVREETGLEVSVGEEVWSATLDLAPASAYEIHTFIEISRQTKEHCIAKCKSRNGESEIHCSITIDLSLFMYCCH